MHPLVLEDLELRRESFQIIKIIVIIHISKKDPVFLFTVYILVELKRIWLNK